MSEIKEKVEKIITTIIMIHKYINNYIKLK